MDRRIFLLNVIRSASLLTLAAQGVLCFADFPGNNSKWSGKITGKDWPKGDSIEDYLKVGAENDQIYGCQMSHSFASSFEQNNFRLLKSSGDFRIDQLMGLESQVLSNTMRVFPGFAFLNDADSPNAFATTAPLLGQRDGTVMFGVRLLSHEYSQHGIGLWDAAIVFIMAHEWGHILEYSRGVKANSKEMELLSDYIGGWYLGWKHVGGKRFSTQGAARSVFSKGDYNFNTPTHHGTPEERLGAAEAGYALATDSRVSSIDRVFSSGSREVGL